MTFVISQGRECPECGRIFVLEHAKFPAHFKNAKVKEWCGLSKKHYPNIVKYSRYNKQRYK
jgi:uncharacterized OB-fold protein